MSSSAAAFQTVDLSMHEIYMPIANDQEALPPEKKITPFVLAILLLLAGIIAVTTLVLMGRISPIYEVAGAAAAIVTIVSGYKLYKAMQKTKEVPIQVVEEEFLASDVKTLALIVESLEFLVEKGREEEAKCPTEYEVLVEKGIDEEAEHLIEYEVLAVPSDVCLKPPLEVL